MLHSVAKQVSSYPEIALHDHVQVAPIRGQTLELASLDWHKVGLAILLPIILPLYKCR